MSPSRAPSATGARETRLRRRLGARVLGLFVVAAAVNVLIFPALNGPWFQGPFPEYWGLRDLGDDRMFSIARDDANTAVVGILAPYLALERYAEGHPLIWYPDAPVDEYYVASLGRTTGTVERYDPVVSEAEAEDLAEAAVVRIDTERPATRSYLVVPPTTDPDEPLRLLTRQDEFFFVPEGQAQRLIDGEAATG